MTFLFDASLALLTVYARQFYDHNFLLLGRPVLCT